MRYRLPETNDQNTLEAFVQEFSENGDSIISYRSGLTPSEYAEWVEKIHNNALTGDDQWGKSLLYLCYDDDHDRLIGLISIRYELPPPLSETIGDVGYGVRPSERNKGYATAMLGHALSVCREKGMKQVLLGCFKDNTASAAVILKNGGVLIAENDNYEDGKPIRYYLIKLSSEEGSFNIT